MAYPVRGHSHRRSTGAEWRGKDNRLIFHTSFIGSPALKLSHLTPKGMQAHPSPDSTG
jgi:hypothetical protein